MNPTLLLLAAAAADREACVRGAPRPPLDAALAVRRAEAARTSPSLLLLGRAPPRSTCPHCGGRRLQRWGRFGLRQRRRCADCSRTFSEFTGTALHRIRRKDRWPEFCRCVLEGQTVRATAARLGVHRDTAFRWRHRLLRDLRSGERHPLGPTVVVGENTLYRRIRLVVGLDDTGRAVGAAIRSNRATPADVGAVIGGRVSPEATVLSVEGRFGAVASYARSAGVSWERRHHVSREWDSRIEPVPIYAFRLRRWMARFRGVAEHYVDNYLAWFRLVDGPVWAGALARHPRDHHMGERPAATARSGTSAGDKAVEWRTFPGG